MADKGLSRKDLGRSLRLGMLSILAMGFTRAEAADAPSADSLAQQNQQLQSELSRLEARVNELESREASTTQATVDAVAHDAQRRTDAPGLAPLEAGFAPTVGFQLRTGDGNFTLHPGIVADIRYMTSIRDRVPSGGTGETTTSGSPDTQSGFDITRLRLILDGTFAQDFGYVVQFQDDQGQNFGLLDAFGTYHFENTPFTLKAGQFKDPVWHERNISEARLEAVDRSYLESLLGGGPSSRVQGAAILYDQDRTRGQLVIHDGYGSSNTKFFDSGGVGTSNTGVGGVTPDNYGVSGRAEYLLIGDRTKSFNPYTEYDQFTALNAKQDILVGGAGFDYTQAGANHLFLHSVDVQYDNTGGLGLYGAYLGSYRVLSTNQGVPPGYFYDPGLLLQASYLVTRQIEPFVRYDYTYLAFGSTGTLATHEVNEITIGANYYLYGQNAKFTLDGVWLPQGAPTDADALGILRDSDHNEFVLRAQFQIAI